jgi:hypothetical protein
MSPDFAMKRNRLLVDSNVIIGYLADEIPDAGMAAVSGIVDAGLHISVISHIGLVQ